MIGTKILRPVIIVGKTGTGKTTMAHEVLAEAGTITPIIRYADEYDITDNFSLPIERGILIEEVHHKPNIPLIVNTLLQYQGQVVLTSLNQKDVSKKIYNLCKLKRAGTKQYLRAVIRMSGVNSQDPINHDKNIFDLLHDYLRNENREEVITNLKLNKPYDEQFLAWLALNIHPHKIAYIDAKVKRKWSQDYFYELLGYAHVGQLHGRAKVPSRRSYSKMPKICKRLGLKPDEERLLKQLLNDESVVEYVSSKVNNSERRLLKIGERVRKPKYKTTEMGLGNWL